MGQQTGQRFILAVTALVGLATATAGGWALLAPGAFADVIDFPPYHEHLIHDVGAFQLGLGVTLLLALGWGDGLAVALAGFLVADTAHAVNHVRDADLGGSGWQAAGLFVASGLVAAAWLVRLRQQGYVLGRVAVAAGPAWVPLVRQKTVALTTFRRDGTPVTTPVSVAVDGDRAYVRTWHTAGKARRLRRDPAVLVAASTGRGRPTGPAVRATARLLAGAEARAAARLLRRKYPVLHGVLVPGGHRLARLRTVHYALTPAGHRA